jgi:hypothetical protein
VRAGCGRRRRRPRPRPAPTRWTRPFTPPHRTRPPRSRSAPTPSVAKIDELTQRLQTDGEALSASGWDVPAELEGAQRLKRALNDGLARQAAAARGESVDAGTVAADQIRLIDAEKYADVFPVMGHTPKEIVDRAYFPLRFKYGAKFEGNDIVDRPERRRARRRAARRRTRPAGLLPLHRRHDRQAGRLLPLAAAEGRKRLRQGPARQAAQGRPAEGRHLYRGPRRGLHPAGLARGAGDRDLQHVLDAHEDLRPQASPTAEDVPTGWRIVAPDQLFLQHRTRLEFLDALDSSAPRASTPMRRCRRCSIA